MLEQPFDDLCVQVSGLGAALRAVQAAAPDDDATSADVRDLLQLLDEILRGAQRAHHAARLPVHIDVVRRAMPRCQHQLSKLKSRFCTGLYAPAFLAELRAAGREETAWHVERCLGPLYAAERAMAACWTSVGQYSALNPGGAIPGFLPPP